jgi:hypothetical protein
MDCRDSQAADDVRLNSLVRSSVRGWRALILWFAITAGSVLTIALSGCTGGNADNRDANARGSDRQVAGKDKSRASSNSSRKSTPRSAGGKMGAAQYDNSQGDDGTNSAENTSQPLDRHPRRSLADLVESGDGPGSTDGGASSDDSKRPTIAPPPNVDEAVAARAGIRKIEGKHVTVFTDLPEDDEVDALPQVFDLAVPQWCAYFDVPVERVGDWRVNAYVIKEKQRFQAAGLFPDKLPPFLNGFQRGSELWLYEQPSAYYRRHLLLHEATHGFMMAHVGGSGPPWYFEGLAELLGTHRWQDGRLELGYMPPTRDDAPYWGRIKVIRDEYEAGRGLSLVQIMKYGPEAHRQNEPYGWCWGAAEFFENHPRYRDAFHRMREYLALDADRFARRFAALVDTPWTQVEEEWQLFVMNVDYGYDVARAAIDFQKGAPLAAEGATVEIAADRGWQSSGILLEEAGKYRLTASGRYQVADKPVVWWCEPGGVTIRYDQGRPLGMLLAAVHDDNFDGSTVSALALPQPIGLEREIFVERGGTLYLRINESPGGLADNAGTLSVRIEKVK